MASDPQHTTIDCEALSISGFATPKVEWFEENMDRYWHYHSTVSRISRMRSPSPLERLPIELRLQIYSYLDFPIEGKIWISVCDEDQCAYKFTGLRGMCHGCRNPLHALWYPRETESRIPVHGIVLSRPDIGLRFDWILDDTIFLAQLLEHHRTTKAYMGLLGASTRIRNELLDLIFRKTFVISDHELSDKAVYMVRNESWTDDGVWLQSTQLWLFPRMRISPSLFPHLTRVHLRRNIGEGWVAPYRGSAYRPHAAWHRRLIKQAMTIPYIADRCPALVHLKFEPYIVEADNCPLRFGYYPLIKIKQSYAKGLVLALIRLVNHCRKLATVQVLTDGNICYNHNGDLGKHLSLSLSQVQHYLREDMTRQWAEVAIKELSDYWHHKHCGNGDE